MLIEEGNYTTEEERIEPGNGWTFWWESFDTVYYRKTNTNSYAALYKERKTGVQDFNKIGIKEFEKVTEHYVKGEMICVSEPFPIGGERFRCAKIRSRQYPEYRIYLSCKNGLISGFGAAGTADEIEQFVTIMDDALVTENNKRSRESTRAGGYERNIKFRKRNSGIKALFILLMLIILIPAIPAAASGIVNKTNFLKTRSELICQLKNPVSRGEQGYIKIKGKPNTYYTPSVKYSSGYSDAAGLYKKMTDGNGYAEWRWNIGTRTEPGQYIIYIRSLQEFDLVLLTVE